MCVKGFVKEKSPIYMVVKPVSVHVIVEFISSSLLGTKMGTRRNMNTWDKDTDIRKKEKDAFGGGRERFSAFT